MNDPGSPAGRGPGHPGVDITIRTASGSGRTTLSAFDHALLNAGVANFNLVVLSSVIPPASTLTLVDGLEQPMPGTHGDRLYCVQATAYAVEPGQQVWAGIGWVVDEDSGKGLFVEHAAAGEAELQHLLETSLGDLVAHRGGGYGETRTATVSATCVDRPACALALAAYEVAGWGARG